MIGITMPTPTTDFSIFDWQELVSYAPVSDDLVADLPALRRPLTQSAMRNVERYVELFSTDVVFHLDGTNLVSKILGPGDAITDSLGVTYLVLVYERQTLNNTVVVVCRHSE
jgi:hypothetical protein